LFLEVVPNHALRAKLVVHIRALPFSSFFSNLALTIAVSLFFSLTFICVVLNYTEGNMYIYHSCIWVLYFSWFGYFHTVVDQSPSQFLLSPQIFCVTYKYKLQIEHT